MNQILRIALTSVAVARARQNIRSLVSFVIAVALAAAVAMAGAGFLLSALWIYLATALSPLAASLIIGGGLLAVAAIVYLVAASLRRRRRAPSGHIPSFAPSSLGDPAQQPVNLATLLAVAGLSYVAGRLLVRR